MQAFVELYGRPETLVLLINANSNWQPCDYNNRENDSSTVQFKRVDNAFSTTDRQLLYASGGVLSITSRILIVDMLTKRLPTALVAGILIANAHTITENSNEAFIIRLFREQNKASVND